MDQPDQENAVSVSILGRSYECVFCKRGFTTAQALGGHMNIHRKDRGKTRPANKHEEINYAGPRFYQPISSFPTRSFEGCEGQLHYRTYFPASASSARANENTNWSCGQSSLECSINPFEVDWRTSLSLQFGGTRAEEDRMVEKRRGGPEDVLDLELRLGYDP